MSTDYNGYTQRDWERAVGWGKVPDKYRRVPTGHTDEQDSERSDTNREKDERTLEGMIAEINWYAEEVINKSK